MSQAGNASNYLNQPKGTPQFGTDAALGKYLLGSNNWLLCAINPVFTLKNFTVEIMFRPNINKAISVLSMTGGSSSTVGFEWNPSYFQVRYNNFSYVGSSSINNGIQQNAWNHVAYVASGGAAALRLKVPLTEFCALRTISPKPTHPFPFLRSACTAII
jgi:hypothetical protein